MSGYSIHAIGAEVVMDRHSGNGVIRTHFDVASFRKLMAEGLDAIEAAEGHGKPARSPFRNGLERAARRFLRLGRRP